MKQEIDTSRLMDSHPCDPPKAAGSSTQACSAGGSERSTPLLDLLLAARNKQHETADRLYHAGDINGGFGARSTACGIQEAIDIVESYSAVTPTSGLSNPGGAQ